MATNYRLSVGQLVSTSLGIYFRNIVPFLFLGTLVMAPWIALQFWLPEAGFEPDQVLVPSLLAMVLQSILSIMLTGAITYGVVQQLRGSPASVGDSVAKGLGSFLRVLGTSLLCGLRIFLFSLLLWVPGIIESVRLYVAIPVAVMEGKAGNVAARRSIELVRGSGWSVFGAWLLIVLLGALIGGVLGFVLAASQPDFDPASPWLSVVITVPLSTLGGTMGAVAYFLLRKGKENIDAAAIAKVFD